jgi:hypothetical protein
VDVRDVNANGFEGLDDFDSASACRDVNAAHLKHLHEGNHGAGRDGKRIGSTHANLDGTAQET